MNISHIEHLGIAVKSLDEAIPYYENILGMKCYSIEEVADQKVKTAFFKVGQTKLELLEPTSDESPIAKFIEKRGEGIHHLGIHVDHDTLRKTNAIGNRRIPDEGSPETEIVPILPLQPQVVYTSGFKLLLRYRTYLETYIPRRAFLACSQSQI